MNLIATLALAVAAVYMGRRLWRGLDSGEFQIGGDDTPKMLIRRADRPLVYWATATVFGTTAALAAVAATFLVR